MYVLKPKASNTFLTASSLSLLSLILLPLLSKNKLWYLSVNSLTCFDVSNLEDNLSIISVLTDCSIESFNALKYLYSVPFSLVSFVPINLLFSFWEVIFCNSSVKAWLLYCLTRRAFNKLKLFINSSTSWSSTSSNSKETVCKKAFVLCLSSFLTFIYSPSFK